MTDLLSVASALFMHTGARHLNFDLTDAQRAIINRPIGKVAILFGMFYMSTRSILWSILLVGIYFLCVNMLLNENHPLNIFSVQWLQKEGYANSSEGVDSRELYYQNLAALS